ncbi:protein LYRIC-like isoform X5 [Synchiropus splendidus]|uniref:protein LYRIC-like isoform X5 n=1 Tax=Synchiropus splendidus TaxID=270530 RepID=UPI00237DA27C|nr:protein LYRIC-like isoform X5 [Synchiropus splendidus]
MEQWQDAASQQVRQLSSRLNEMVTRGLDVLRTELGVDLGLKPELIPPWALLLAACSGLVLMVVLWASLFRALFKKRPVPNPSDEVNELKRGLAKPVKSEEPKKKKKKAEKKAQPNGRAVAESQEEAIVPDERVPHHQPPPPETKTDKAAEASVSSSPVNRHGPQVKKSKKKAKQVAKETKSGTADGKEPEEGTWETKVSNKEKREQRKKDKNSSDGSASPGGGDSLASAPPEQTKVSAAPAPAPSQKKKKGESKQKAEKVDTAVPQVTTNSSETPAVVSAAVTKRAVKVPSHNVTPKMVPWTGNREPPSLWGGDIDESWTVIDRGMQPADLGLVSFSKLGVASDGGAVDPSSDWNAPSEAWGNYEEPTLLQPPLVKEQTNHEQDNDEDKDNGDNSADGAAKTKKKKKKKKKAAEEGGVSGQGDVPEKKEEPAAPVKKQPPSAQEKNATVQHVKAAVEAKAERPVKEHISQKPAVTQVPQKPTDGEPTAKQNNCPAPVQQKKAEESQPPKPAKKKKVRRET